MFDERNVEIDELELESDEIGLESTELGDAVSLEGVELEEEMRFIKQHFCSETGELPLYLLVEDEYFELGRVDVNFETMLSLAATGTSYRVFLHLDGKVLSMTEPENLMRLIDL